MHWWTDVPADLAVAAYEQIASIRAEESFVMAERVALGTGSLTRGDAASVKRRWQRQCDGGRRRRQRTVGTPGSLQSLGIKVIGGAR